MKDGACIVLLRGVRWRNSLQTHQENRMKTYHRLLFVGGLLLGGASAGATLPQTQPDRVVEVHRISAPAEQLLFQLAYAAQPLCQKEPSDWTWSMGSFPRTIPPVRNDKLPAKWQAEIDALAARYNIAPGASIFLSDIDKTPWGYAGFKTLEPFEFAGQEQDVLRFYAAPKPDATGPNVREKDPGANPLVEFSVKRNGDLAKVVVRRVPVCQLSLTAVDGKYRYADSDGARVIVTVPLLARLSRDELVAVLSHEVAHVALQLSRGRSRNKATATLLFGELAKIGENQESGLTEPQAADLIKADRLAMRLSSGFGVDVPAYVGIMRNLVKDEDSFGAPTYRRTRGIDQRREEQLQRSLDLWVTQKKFYTVPGLDLQLEREASRRARQVYSDPAALFSAVPNTAKVRAPQAISGNEDSVATEGLPVAEQHAGKVPPSTKFAALDDVDALPRVTPTGRSLYREWLTKPFPRAVALSDKGAIARGYGTDAMDRAIRVCQKFNNPCRLYAVDDQIVWTAP